MCAGEIGPAIAVGLSIGSSIVTSNGIPITSDQLLKESSIIQVPLTLVDPSDSSDTEAVLESDLRKELLPISVHVPHASEEIDSGSEHRSSVPPVCPVDHTVGKELLNAVIPCNIDQLFTMLFTNSTFYLDFQLARKTCDINQSDWQLGEGSQKTRQLTFTVLTGQSLGPKQSHITETQTLLPASCPGMLYAIQSESVNAGIPYADAFSVNCHYCLSKVSSNEARLIVISKVNYKKSTWAKAFIEKNSMSALVDFFNHMERALKEECAKMNAGGITPTSPIIVTNIPRRRHPRKKCRAPDIPNSPLTRPIVDISIAHQVGSRPSASTTAPEEFNETVVDNVESSLVMKIILTVLGCLLLLNAFLYFKLSNLETAANSTSVMYPPPPIRFSGETPQTHQEWLVLLQQQETLHRSEVHGWHEILVSAIKILHQAETDLENLKAHISTYGRSPLVNTPAHSVPLDILNQLNAGKGHQHSSSDSSPHSSPSPIGSESVPFSNDKTRLDSNKNMEERDKN